MEFQATHSDFITAGRILFGDGQLDRLPELLATFGVSRAALVTGAGPLEQAGHASRVRAALEDAGVEIIAVTIDGEPKVGTVDSLVETARPSGAELVVAMGGGSALDAGKAVAGLLANGGSVLEYLEGVGSGRAIEKPALPCIAIPTTAGTGSEVTKNSVITGDDGGFKKSLRSPYLLARIALVDPLLTHSCPRNVTAACGYDALTQLVESYTSNNSGPITDALAVDGIRKAAWALPRVLTDGGDAEARRGMALASLFGGMCLANAGLGAVHGMASALGALSPIPHGVACALGLPGVMEANARRLQASAPAHPCLDKLRQACSIIVGDGVSGDPVSEACAQIRRGLIDADIPRLGAFGITGEDLGPIVAGSRGSSMKYNPVELSDDDLNRILEEWL